MSKISDLSITYAEVSRASNLTINQINFAYNNRKTIVSISKSFEFKFSSPLFIVTSPFLLILFITVLTNGNDLELFIIIIFFTILIAICYFHEKNMYNIKKIFKHFLNLYIQVLNFNSLIESAEALDEAGRSGGSNRLENREKVIKALTSIRADLISALRIEKAFRENPNFSSSSFTPNLEPLQFLQLSEQSSEYGRLFNEALQIGMNVQEEMQTLQRR